MQAKLTFLGAAQNVTGSRYLIEVNGKRILVDCGLYQERDLRERNWALFHCDPHTLDAILLTHAHLDHCGMIPKLVAGGFDGKIYCTSATAEIAQIVMLDAAHLQEEDAEYKRKRHKKEGRTPPHPEVPLYTVDDAKNCEKFFAPINYNQKIEVCDGIEAEFYDVGHILGSSMVEITLRNASQHCSLLFSGDVGRWNKPILHDPTFAKNADYIFIESTYGNRVHKDPQNIETMLEEIINSTRQAGGNIIIPTFALERAQEVLYYLNKLLLADRIPPLTVFVDSPMAINVTDVFKHHPELFDAEMLDLISNHESPFSFPNLRMSKTVNQSKAINEIKGTVIVLAGSGMCTGGRIKHHLVQNIHRPESTILFVGYQAVGTLGRQILEKPKEVRILGQIYPVRARIEKINGFSAHADKNELLHWLSKVDINPKCLFVTHGEPESAISFANLVEQEKQWKTAVPKYQDEVTFDF